MVEYKCLICNFKTNIKTHYTRHLQTIKHKKKENEGTKNLPRIPTYTHVLPRIATSPENKDNTTQNISETLIAPVIDDKSTNPKYILCDYCNNYCSKKMFMRHLREYCVYVPENKKKSLIDKYNKHKSSKTNKLITMNNNTNNTNITNNNNNINNTNNITNNNTNNGTINNNNNITIINPFGQEDLSFLTNEDKEQILLKRYMGVPELIKKIHSHPSNQNLFIPNVNKKIVAFLSKDNKIEYDDYTEICNQMIDNNIDRFDDIFMELSNKLSKSVKKKIQEVIDENNNNENINKKYTEDIKYYIMNWSKEIKEHLLNYVNVMREKLKTDIDEKKFVKSIEN